MAAGARPFTVTEDLSLRLREGIPKGKAALCISY